jgi:lysozyme family protein
MADFTQALALTLQAEGGYGNDPQDPGGETYKGIARKMNSKWDGWIDIDALKRQADFPASLDGNAPLQEKIGKFYELNYWDKVRGDEIVDQDIAASIFDFAVNAGPIASIKLAQLTVATEANGVIDDETLHKINADDPRAFLALFALHKIARYVGICDKRQESRKFFFGWVKRALGTI